MKQHPHISQSLPVAGRVIRNLILTAAVIFLGSWSLSAQPPVSLDFSFGNEGIVTTDFGAAATHLGAEILSDGKSLIVATLLDEGIKSLLLMRFLPDGAPDTSFGVQGQINTSLPPQFESSIHQVKINREDGSFMIISTNGNGGNYTLVRFLPDGDVDTSFGNEGIVREPFNYFDSYMTIALQPDGKIVAGGMRTSISGYHSFLIARFNSDGSNDSTFGVSGRVVFYEQDHQIIRAIAVQPDGKIVVSGNNFASGAISPQLYTMRVFPDGQIDDDFGVNGVVYGGKGMPGSVRFQPDGKILINTGLYSGYGPESDPEVWAIERYLPNGMPDLSFGIQGRVNASQQVVLSGMPGMLQLADDKLLLFGISQLKTSLLRYHSDGSPDTDFGNNGMAIADFGGAVRGQLSLLPQQDNLLLIGNINQDDILLGRCLADGSIDDTFGQDGSVVMDFGSEQIQPGQVVHLSDGRVIASAIMGNRFVLVRYLEDGAIDEAFGNAGRAIYNYPSYSYLSGVPLIRLDSQGGIIASFYFQENIISVTSRHVIRFHPNGIPDYTFGSNGLANLDFDQQAFYCSALSVLNDGKILLAGTYVNNIGTPFFAMARFHATGQADSTFGVFGKAISQTANNVWCHDMAVQPDGRIVLTGETEVSGYPRFVSARYLPHGFIDASFGQNGRADKAFPGEWAGLRKVIVQPDGKIVASGGVSGNLTLVRYLANGSLDSSFGVSGVYRNPGIRSHSLFLNLQPDGSILISGQTILGPNNRPLLSFLLNTSGVADDIFGVNGFQHAPPPNNLYVLNVEFLPGNKILKVFMTSGRLVLARYRTALAVSARDFDTQADLLKVHPNPTSGRVLLEGNVPMVSQGIPAGTLYDALGRVVLRFPLHVVNGQIRQELDLGHLQAGMYIYSAGGVSGRIVLLR